MLRKYFYGLTCFISCVSSIYADSPDLMKSEIKHVVILMLENRSFDNVMAWLYENQSPSQFIPANTDPVFLGLSEDTLAQYTNTLTNSLGEVVFTCAPIKGIPSVAATKFLNSPKFDPNEPFADVTVQIFGANGGTTPTMLGFLQDYATLWDEHEWLSEQQNISAVMETLTDKELPILYGLGRHYAVSDLWFSSVPTQTNPNRAFLFMGTSEGEIVNGILGKNDFQSDTLWNRLSEESPATTWKIFWQSDMTPVLFPGPYSGTNTFAALGKIPHLEEHFQTFDHFHDQARKGQLPAISYLEPQWTLSLNISPKEKEMLDSYFDQDVIVGCQGNDMHPPGDVRTGENLLANIYTSLCSNQDAWQHTLLIITFDEHGGLFDHVPPPAAIAPDDYAQNGFGFDRYGVRVPTLFISPLIQKGTVIRSDDPTTPFDHTSIIATLLQWANVDKSKWNMGNRVNVAPTFENVITLTTPRTDYVIGDNSTAATGDPVNFGDLFCLRNRNGQYFCSSSPAWLHLATLGPQNDKVCLEFTCGSGALNHGAFSLLVSHEPYLGNAKILETVTRIFDCTFTADKHHPCQWWTIKSVENPQLGATINYGDRIYLENHVYLDLVQLVPARLSPITNIFGEHLTTETIIADDSDENYWIIERP